MSIFADISRKKLKILMIVVIYTKFHAHSTISSWKNQLRQICHTPRNCVSVFDHFVGLALKELKTYQISYQYLQLSMGWHLSKFLILLPSGMGKLKLWISCLPGLCIIKSQDFAEAYLEPQSNIYDGVFLVKIDNDQKPLTIFAKELYRRCSAGF